MALSNLPRSAVTAPRASSIIFISTTPDLTDGRARTLDPYPAAPVGDFRQIFSRGNLPGGRHRHLRYPRVRREAEASAFRRSAVPRRLGQPLSARRVS